MRKLLLALTLPFLFVGCTSIQSKMDAASMSMKASLNMIPVSQCTAFWDAAVRHDKELEKPERGFAGRAYFYGDDSRYPVKITDGHVVVYAFDEIDRAVDDHAPDRSHVFTPKDLKRFYSKSKIGHSYSLWIPWDTQGPDGEAKQVALIVKYVPPRGSSIVSQQAKVYIPGKIGDRMIATKADWDSLKSADGSIRQVAQLGHQGIKRPQRVQANVIERAYRPDRMLTTTFELAGPLSKTGQLAETTTLAPVLARTQGTGAQPANGMGGREEHDERLAAHHAAGLPYPHDAIQHGAMQQDAIIPESYLPMSYHPGREMPTPAPAQFSAPGNITYPAVFPNPYPNQMPVSGEAGPSAVGRETIPLNAWPPSAWNQYGGDQYGGYPPSAGQVPNEPGYHYGPPGHPAQAGPTAPLQAAPQAFSPFPRESRSTLPHGEPVRR